MSMHARADEKLLKKNMTASDYVNAVDSTINKKIDNILMSDKTFHQMMLDADAKDLLDKSLTDKQRATFQTIVDADNLCYSFATQSSSSGSTFKINTISSGNHHSPIQMSNDASRKVVEARQDFAIAHKILQERAQGDKIYTYMITLTVKNARKGTLKKEIKKIKKAMTKLRKRLNSADSRKSDTNTILVSKNVDVDYLGGVYSIEIVINEERLMNMQVNDLFNHHIHFLMMTNEELDIEATSENIYRVWNEINTDMKVKTDRQAFDMQKAHTNADNVIDFASKETKNSFSSDLGAFKEVVKYALKPSVYVPFSKILEKGSDAQKQFALEVFAEYYNTVHNAHQQVRLGIMKEAASFRKQHKEIVNAMFTDAQFNDFAEFSDVLTHERVMKRENNEMTMLSKRKMFDEEIIFHNRSLVESVLLTSEARERLQALMMHATDKELFNLKILNSFDYVTDIDTYYKKLDEKIDEFDRARALMNDALDECKSEKMRRQNKQEQEQINFKKEDLIALRDALQSTFSRAGRARIHNFDRDRKSEQRRILFDMFKKKHEHATLEQHEMFEEVVKSLKITNDLSNETLELSLFAKVDNSFFAKHFPNAYQSLVEFERDMNNLTDVVDAVDDILKNDELFDVFEHIVSLENMNDVSDSVYIDDEFVRQSKIEASTLTNEYSVAEIEQALIKIDELALV